jgi:hypothetical protein
MTPLLSTAATVAMPQIHRIEEHQVFSPPLGSVTVGVPETIANFIEKASWLYHCVGAKTKKDE